MRSMLRRREYDTLPDEGKRNDNSADLSSVHRVVSRADHNYAQSQYASSSKSPNDDAQHSQSTSDETHADHSNGPQQHERQEYEPSSSPHAHHRSLEIEPSLSIIDVYDDHKDGSRRNDGRRRRRRRQNSGKDSRGIEHLHQQEEDDDDTYPPLTTKSGLLLSHRRPRSSPRIVPYNRITTSVSYSPLSNHLTGTDAGTPGVTPTHRHIHSWRQRMIQPSQRWSSRSSRMRQPCFERDKEYNEEASCAATLCTERRRPSSLSSYNGDPHMLPHHRVVLSPVRVWIALLITCAIIGTGIACVAVHYHNHNNSIDHGESMRTAEPHDQEMSSSLVSSVSLFSPTSSMTSPVERSLSNFVKVDKHLLKHLQEVNQARQRQEQLSQDSMGLSAILFAGDGFMKRPLEGESFKETIDNSTNLDVKVIKPMSLDETTRQNIKENPRPRQRRLQHQDRRGAHNGDKVKHTTPQHSLQSTQQKSSSSLTNKATSSTAEAKKHSKNSINFHHFDLHSNHRHLSHLLDPFRDWVNQHERQYQSHDETHNRFLIWAHNHAEIEERNRRHGPCKLTGKPVFGSNKFQDLTDEEFNSQFLTGYHPPHLQRHPIHGNRGNQERRSLNTMQRESPLGSVEGGAAGSGPEDAEHDIPVLQPRHPVHGVSRHPKIQKAFEEQWYANMRQRQLDNDSRNEEQEALTQKDHEQDGRRLSSSSSSLSSGGGYMAEASTSWCSFEICKWNIYCWINCVRSYYEGGSYGTMIPSKNNAWSTNDSNGDGISESVDWRKLGVVTDVHSQGQCGACWAITARETIESAYAIDSGTLLDLDETEVIICDDTCQMCNGGWPQNAYEFVQKIGGLQIKGSTSLTKYDGDFLLKLTMANQGYYDSMTGDEISYYKSLYCRAANKSGNGNNNNKNGGNNRSGSGDREEEGQHGDGYGASTYITSSSVSSSSSSSSSSPQRYGKIKGYGYTTNKCVCYTNGNGCDCDSQNESLAIQNLATYGPATVCLDASNWKQYTGGIMTTDVGCSAAFLSMNHCVQVVGYAFLNSSSDGDGDEYYYENNSNSRSNKSNNNKKSNQNDDENREGYWIVRNQWSNSWGMNGYAYVAMGSNTCGILNDMTNVFLN